MPAGWRQCNSSSRFSRDVYLCTSAKNITVAKVLEWISNERERLINIQNDTRLFYLNKMYYISVIPFHVVYDLVGHVKKKKKIRRRFSCSSSNSGGNNCCICFFYCRYYSENTYCTISGRYFENNHIDVLLFTKYSTYYYRIYKIYLYFPFLKYYYFKKHWCLKKIFIFNLLEVIFYFLYLTI